MKIGRNDPCWCGSGDKYKRCHQAADEDRAREEKSLKTLAEWVSFHARALCDDARRKLGDDEQARADWFGDATPDDPWRDAGFMQHALFDRPGAEGDSAVVAAEIGEGPSSAELTQLRGALAMSFASLHEVTECKRGKGLRLKDRLVGTERWVADAVLADALDPLEIVWGRLLTVDKRPVLLDGWARVHFRGRKKVVADLTAAIAEAGLAEDALDERSAWLRQQAPRVWRRVLEARP